MSGLNLVVHHMRNMNTDQRIECMHCGERNSLDNSVCSYCQNELVIDNVTKCPKCGILISAYRNYCRLCNIRKVKGGAIGCTYVISILLFSIGLIVLFINYRIAIMLLIIAILLYILIFILVKLRSNNILKMYPIKRKMTL